MLRSPVVQEVCAMLERLSIIIMQRNNNKVPRNSEAISIILIVMLIILCCLTGCASVPDTCQQGVPTNKACLSAQGTKGSFGFGPINIITARF